MKSAQQKKHAFIFFSLFASVILEEAHMSETNI